MTFRYGVSSPEEQNRYLQGPAAKRDAAVKIKIYESALKADGDARQIIASSGGNDFLVGSVQYTPSDGTPKEMKGLFSKVLQIAAYKMAIGFSEIALQNGLEPVFDEGYSVSGLRLSYQNGIYKIRHFKPRRVKCHLKSRKKAATG